MTKLEKGMYVKLLEDMTIYDPNTFEPIVIKAESHGEIEYVGFGFPNNKDHKLWPLISVKFKEGAVVFAGEKAQQFNKQFELI